MSTVSGSRFQVPSSTESDPRKGDDEPTPTQRVYRPIATLDAEHRAAFTEMQVAVARGDEPGMKAAFDRIMFIQAEQEIAHRAAREYIRSKILKLEGLQP